VRPSLLLPLLVRRPLWPDESLYSYLIRLADLNRYPLSGLLSLGLAYETETGRRLDNAFYPKRPQTYARLAGLTQLSPAALYRATPHRFATLLALSRKTVKTIAIPGDGERPALTDQRAYTLRSERQAQFCPRCLHEAAYHRLWWTPVFVLVCLRHQCLLAARCPGCGQEVSLAEVVKAECRRCRAELTETPVQSVQDDRFGLFVQQTLKSWLEGRSPAPGAWTASLAPQPPAALYYLAVRLMMGLLREMQPTSRWTTPQLCKRLKPDVVYALWTRAFRALVCWPEGLYEFMEAQTVEGLLRGCGPAVADLNGRFQFRPSLLIGRNLVFARLSAAEANPDLRWRQPDHCRRAGDTQAIARHLADFPYMTIGAAARTLGAPQIMVQRLVLLGRLRGAPEQGEVLRADVLKLVSRWRQPMTLPEAGALTGLAPAQLRGLMERGMIQRLRSRPGVKSTQLVRDSVCEFMLAMAGRLCPKATRSRRRVKVGPDEEMVGFAASIALAAQFRFTAADLLDLIRKGRLHACLQASPPDLGAVRFPRRHLLGMLRWLRRIHWRG